MRYLAFALALVSCAAPVFAQDENHGGVLAEKWCSACHDTGAGQVKQKSLVDGVPTFATISGMRQTAAIIATLRNPHGGMPTDAMNDRDIQDVAAYIKSIH